MSRSGEVGCALPYLSDEIMGKLKKLPIVVDVSEQEKAESWNGELWYNAMLTE